MGPYPPYASLVVWGERLDPARVTATLGIAPDDSFRQGDTRGESGETWPHGYWELDSSQNLTSADLVAHISWLLGKLEPRASKLMQLAQDNDIEVQISCFWIMPSSNEVLALNSDLLRRLGALGIELELDIRAPS